jgi:hypothetical protein
MENAMPFWFYLGLLWLHAWHGGQPRKERSDAE